MVNTKLRLIKEDKLKKKTASIVAVEYLIEAFNEVQQRAVERKNKVHINLIITAKRHKNVKEFENNVNLAVKFYGVNEENGKELDNFWKSPCEIVSFDIAGIEKGNRVSKFRDQLHPLLINNVPTTIHAGEEDGSDAIWEAIYYAHVHRIGHGLTLGEDKKLQHIVRETRI